MATIEKQVEAQSVAHFPYTHGNIIEHKRNILQADVKRAWADQVREARSGRESPHVLRSESVTPDLRSPQLSARDASKELGIGKSHKPVDFVRQLDRTAMKNCMELALLRREKELSVKQARREQEENEFVNQIEQGRIQNQVEKENRKLMQGNNKRMLIQQKILKEK